MKKTIAVMLALVLALSLCAFAGADEKVTVKLGGLKGPTSMGMVKLLDDAENGLTANNYEFTMAGSADELTPRILKGELDILAVPANLGAILGRTIYATGKGSTPEYALTYLLAQHGLDISTDVTVEWKSEPTEVVAQMATEETSVAMLPQPFVTVAAGQLEGLRIAIDLTAEWDSLKNGSQFVTAGLIVRKAFAEENPEALKTFLEEYAASTAYANEQPAEAAQLIEKYGIVKAAVAEKAIPYCNIVCITGAEMQQMVSGYFGVLFEQNPKAVGGELPGEDFFLIYE